MPDSDLNIYAPAAGDWIAGLVPPPSWVRPAFTWSPETLETAEKYIDKFDSLWQYDGYARLGSPDTIVVQVKRILGVCLTEYYKFCGGKYDGPDVSQADFEKMCLRAFPALIFKDRDDWGECTHRFGGLDGPTGEPDRAPSPSWDRTE